MTRTTTSLASPFHPTAPRSRRWAVSESEVRVWKVDDGRLLHRFKSQALNPHAPHIPALSFSPDGTVLAATLQTGNLVPLGPEDRA